MSPRNYKSRDRIERYVNHPNFIYTAPGKAEIKVERFVIKVLRSLFKSRRRNKS
jgi:hypothetical protein